jgi:hypothetical protein
MWREKFDVEYGVGKSVGGHGFSEASRQMPGKKSLLPEKRRLRHEKGSGKNLNPAVRSRKPQFCASRPEKEKKQVLLDALCRRGEYRRTCRIGHF